MRCLFCNREFPEDEAVKSCGGCGAKKGCRMICCPRCGYKMPVEPKWLKELKIWIKKEKNKMKDHKEVQKKPEDLGIPTGEEKRGSTPLRPLEKEVSMVEFFNSGYGENACLPVDYLEPRPHEKTVSTGHCCGKCKREKKGVVSLLSDMNVNEQGMIVYVEPKDRSRLNKLMALGVFPGLTVTMIQTFPSYVFQIGQSQFAIDREMAEAIYVRTEKAHNGQCERRWQKLLRDAKDGAKTLLKKKVGMINVIALLPVMLTLSTTSTAFPSDIETRLNLLEEALKKQQKKTEEQQNIIDRLKDELATGRQLPENQGEVKSSDPLRSDPEPPKTSGRDVLISGAVNDFFKNLKNPAMTLVLNGFYYSSSVNGRDLKKRGIPGFSAEGLDQNKGFNIDEFSMAAFAPVDQLFDLFGVVSFKEEEVSIEEAYFYTKNIPGGFRLKAGKLKSGFSVHNEKHPHEWDFADTALVYKGLLGRDGIMEKGVQLTYQPSLPFKPLLGIELLQGENKVIFNQNSQGGPHAFTAFLKIAKEFNKDSSLYFGPYMIKGQTRTETASGNSFFRGNSNLYGFEANYEWKPSDNRSFIVQGEYMRRDQIGTVENVLSGDINRLFRSQDGIYIQSLYQIGRWRMGVRYDLLNLLRDTYSVGGTQKNYHRPLRLTGAIEFNPTEYSRLRLQYNHDRSGGGFPEFGGGSRVNNEIYLQMIFAIGAHVEPSGQHK
ncbi:MAG: FeoA domain-containing protein [Syntrophorhabdaceae bacterium]|nr:FeoA domain-containing protein [Syntrophorhabdaceae bacterium]